MNNLKKSHIIVRQNDKNVIKSQKHDANLQNNATLYFQVGLILCLLGSYLALEMNFATTTQVFVHSTEPLYENFEPVPKDFVIEKKEVKQLPEPKPEQPKAPEYKAVDNDTKVDDLVKKMIQPVIDKPTQVAPINTDELKVPEIEEVVSIMAVQKVPIYPGCEKKNNNIERRKCMSNKLGKLIQKKFDTDIGAENGLSGLQKIDVFFKINKQGEVVILKTRAPHPALDKEAKRIVGKIPTLQPGMNNNKPVEVSYNLPIKFSIQN